MRSLNDDCGGLNVTVGRTVTKKKSRLLQQNVTSLLSLTLLCSALRCVVLLHDHEGSQCSHRSRGYWSFSQHERDHKFFPSLPFFPSFFLKGGVPVDVISMSKGMVYARLKVEYAHPEFWNNMGGSLRMNGV